MERAGSGTECSFFFELLDVEVDDVLALLHFLRFFSFVKGDCVSFVSFNFFLDFLDCFISDQEAEIQCF